MLFSREGILALIVSIPGVLLAITMHECAHGYAAYLMGDNTAKYSGRLSLNPLKHLDPIGALCMLFFRFGWAKPVPINPQYFKNRRAGIIIVSLAGPFANFILGLLSAIIYYAIAVFALRGQSTAIGASAVSFLANIFQYSVFMNAGLMIFNLVPIPPLDGSKILLEFLPPKAKYTIYRYERYFSLILIIIVYAGAMTPTLSALQAYVIRFYNFVCSAIFGL